MSGFRRSAAPLRWDFTTPFQPQLKISRPFQKVSNTIGSQKSYHLDSAEFKPTEITRGQGSEFCSRHLQTDVSRLIASCSICIAMCYLAHPNNEYIHYNKCQYSPPNGRALQKVEVRHTESRTRDLLRAHTMWRRNHTARPCVWYQSIVFNVIIWCRYL